jgi:methionyl-tRNA formyltransferase
LLPRWRGAAPIHRAIEAGDVETGVSVMQMDAGLDTGDVLCMTRTPIGPQETTGQLHDRLATLGAQAMVQALTQLDQLPPQPQPAEGVTYAHKIDKAEAALNWQRRAAELARQLRAFDPFPGGTAQLEGTTIKVWSAQALPDQGRAPAGTVLAVHEDGIDVATGDGVLRLKELQRPGGKRLPCSEFLRGHRIEPGAVFEAQGA